MGKDDILRKVRGLLKLGESDNPHEAASATAQAARLMEKHAIKAAALELDESQPIEAEPVQDFEEPITHGRKVASWMYRLAVAITKANGCFVWQQTGGKLRIAGTPTGADNVRYLFAYCSREIDRITRQNCRGEGRTYANNYRIGCVAAIAEAIERERESVRTEMRAEAKADPKGTSALVAVNQAIAVVDQGAQDARKFAYKKHKLRQGRGSGYRGNANARGAGKAAGAGIYPGGGGKLGSGSRRLGSG